ALMALIIFPVMVFPVSNIGRKLKKFSHKGQQILGNINATILESFSGIHPIEYSKTRFAEDLITSII
ncbi:MAG: hypothetical protein QF830_04785, partial [Rhodospirillales bacterium]|nr:hypothetical protein [Rhodospirillales bacterium]